MTRVYRVDVKCMWSENKDKGNKTFNTYDEALSYSKKLDEGLRDAYCVIFEVITIESKVTKGMSVIN